MTRKTVIYKGLSIRDPAPYGEAGLAWQNNFKALADRIAERFERWETLRDKRDDQLNVTLQALVANSLWYDSAATRVYWCASAAAGAAAWIEISRTGITRTVAIKDADAVTHSLVFTNGLLTGYSTVP